MKIEIIGKNVSITDAMRNVFEKKIRRLSKYVVFEDETKVRILVRTYDRKQKVEVTIPTKFGVLRAEASDFDAYAALDAAVDKIEGQVRKHKTKLEKRHRSSITENLIQESAMAEEEDIPIRTKTVELEELSLDDAIMKMELSDHSFYAFLDEDTGRVSIVYCREAGGYGVIETR